MKRVLLFLALVVAASAFAAPCVVATAEVYQAQGVCSVGSGPNQLFVSDVFWSDTTGSGFQPAPAGSVKLTPELGPDGKFAGLGFSSAVTPNVFDVAPNMRMLAFFGYTIDPRPPIMNGYRLTIDPSGAGTATLTATVESGLKPEGATVPPVVNTSQLRVGFNVSGLPATTEVSFADANYVKVLVKLDIDNRGKDSRLVIEGGDTGATLTTSITPEPGAFGLAIAGLLALGTMAWRRRA